MLELTIRQPSKGEFLSLELFAKTNLQKHRDNVKRSKQSDLRRDVPSGQIETLGNIDSCGKQPRKYSHHI